ARDKLLPPRLAEVDSVSGTPRAAVIAGAVVAIPVAGALPIGLLGELVSTGTLMAFATVCAAVVVLRLREPGRARPFSIPAWQAIAPLGVLSCLFLLYNMGWGALGRILAWQV